MERPILIVVDDDPQVAELLADIGEGIGYTAMTAAGAHDLWALLEACTPEVIVVDLIMPNVDGIELVQGLAQRGTAAGLLFISGSDELNLHSATLIARHRGLHVLGALPKPFTVAEVETLLATRRNGA